GLAAGAERVERALVGLVGGVAWNREALEPAIGDPLSGEGAEERQEDPGPDDQPAPAYDPVGEALEHAGRVRSRLLRCQIIVDQMNTSAAQCPEEPLGRHLVFTAKAMRAAFEETLAAAGGSLGTWVVLSALSSEGLISQTALAGHIQLEGATITHHIDRLEALGLVRRQADPA